MESIVNVQKAIYGPDGPPLLPHGDDPQAIRANRKKRRRLPNRLQVLPYTTTRNGPAGMFPASELPQGFPPELAFRALAAYSLVRTLSIQLRLSPFTPTAFLRALYFPYPNRLMGQVHVALLRHLLGQLHAGYHWRGAKRSFFKKRKVDGLRLPLRAGDNLEYLDTYTWPVFFDDYCHLTADVAFASLNDKTEWLDVRSLHIATVEMPGESSHDAYDRRSAREKPTVIYMNDEGAEEEGDVVMAADKPDSDEEFGYDDAMEDDEDDDDYEAAPRPRKRGKTHSHSSSSQAQVHAQHPSYPSRPPPQAPLYQGTGVQQLPPGMSQQNMRQLPPGMSQQQLLPYSRALLHAGVESSQIPSSPQLVQDLADKRARMQATQEQLRSMFWTNQGNASPPPSLAQPQSWQSAAQMAALPHMPGQPQSPGMLPRGTFQPPVMASPTSRLQQTVPMPNSPSATLPVVASSNGSTASVFAASKLSAPIVPIQPAVFSSVASIQSVESALPTSGAFVGTVDSKATETPLLASPSLISTSKPEVTEAMTPAAAPVAVAFVGTVDSKATETPLLAGPSLISTSKPEVPEAMTPAAAPVAVPSRPAPLVGNADSKATETPLLAGPSLISTSKPEVTEAMKPAAAPVAVSSRPAVAEALSKTEVSASAPRVHAAAPMPPVASDAYPMNESSERSIPAFRTEYLSPKANERSPLHRSTPVKSPIPLNLNGSLGPLKSAVLEISDPPAKSVASGGGEAVTQLPGVVSATLSSSSRTPMADGTTVYGGNAAASVQPDISKEVQQTLSTAGTTDQPGVTVGSATFSAQVPMSLSNNGVKRERPATAVLSGASAATQRTSATTVSVASVPVTSAALYPMTMKQSHALPVAQSNPAGALPSVFPTTNQNANVVDRPAQVTTTVTKAAPGRGSSTPAAKKSISLRKEDSNGILSAFIQGRDYKASSDDMSVDGGMEIDDSDSEASFSSRYLHDADQWPQFRPLRTMRSGIPYHRLPLGEKLDALEFLLDEILSDANIADEFNRRQVVTTVHNAPYNDVPYGCLPTVDEFNNLENQDECGVCRKEGDLLCCDGCIASYHRTCLDMPQEGGLPEGRWLCPECQIVDPSKLGSLHGGRKCAVDWFTKSDLLRAASCKSNLMEGGALGSMPTQAADLNQCAREGQDESGPEFLVIHGFVFSRGRQSESTKQNCLPACTEQKVLPLSQNALKGVVGGFGTEGLTQWPLEQIPVDPRQIWVVPPPSRSSPYAPSMEMFDPSVYQNRYRKAPYPPPWSKAKEPNLSDYETQCYGVSTSSLTARLSRDGYGDSAIVQSLCAGTNLFDPYQLIKNTLLELEKKLGKSFLGDVRWCTRNPTGALDTWANSVRKCVSIPRLAQLALKLVDAAHPRSFLESWYHVAGSKSQDAVSSKESLEERQVYYQLSLDTTPEAESLRRHWEQSTPGNIPSLLAKESSRLEDWISEIRPDLAAVTLHRTKRKQTRAAVAPVLSKTTDSTAIEASQFAFALNGASTGVQGGANQTANPSVNLDEDAGDQDNGVERKGTESDYHDATNVSTERPQNKRNKRRSGRIKMIDNGSEGTGSALGVDVDGSVPSITKRIGVQKRLKMSALAEEIRTQTQKETVWPVAGRKLFDPAGYLPPTAARRLGKNAGSVAAPFVAYPLLYEVGQVSNYHVWRKRVKQCGGSFEELLMQVRVLDSFVDSATVRKCTSLAKRVLSLKDTARNEIRSTQKDIKTGLDCYLVQVRGQQRVAWFSSLAIDLPTLIHERVNRRQVLVNKCIERRTASLMEERAKERAAFEAARAAASAAADAALARSLADAARARALEDARRAHAIAAAETSRAYASAEASRTYAAAEAARAYASAEAARVRSLAEAEAARRAREVAAIEASRAESARAAAQPSYEPMISQQPGYQHTYGQAPIAAKMPTKRVARLTLKEALDRILSHHKAETLALLQRFGSTSDSSDLDSQLQALRLTSGLRLKGTISSLGPSLGADQIMVSLKRAELEVIQAVPQSAAPVLYQQSAPPATAASVNSHPRGPYPSTVPQETQPNSHHPSQISRSIPVQPQFPPTAALQALTQDPNQAYIAAPAAELVQQSTSAAHDGNQWVQVQAEPGSTIGQMGVSDPSTAQAYGQQQQQQQQQVQTTASMYPTSNVPQSQPAASIQQPIAPPVPAWGNLLNVSTEAATPQVAAPGWIDPNVNGGVYQSQGASTMNGSYQDQSSLPQQYTTQGMQAAQTQPVDPAANRGAEVQTNHPPAPITGPNLQSSSTKQQFSAQQMQQLQDLLQRQRELEQQKQQLQKQQKQQQQQAEQQRKADVAANQQSLPQLQPLQAYAAPNQQSQPQQAYAAPNQQSQPQQQQQLHSYPPPYPPPQAYATSDQLLQPQQAYAAPNQQLQPQQQQQLQSYPLPQAYAAPNQLSQPQQAYAAPNQLSQPQQAYAAPSQQSQPQQQQQLQSYPPPQAYATPDQHLQPQQAYAAPTQQLQQQQQPQSYPPPYPPPPYATPDQYLQPQQAYAAPNQQSQPQQLQSYPPPPYATSDQHLQPQQAYAAPNQPSQPQQSYPPQAYAATNQQSQPRQQWYPQ